MFNFLKSKKAKIQTEYYMLIEDEVITLTTDFKFKYIDVENYFKYLPNRLILQREMIAPFINGGEDRVLEKLSEREEYMNNLFIKQKKDSRRI